VTLTVPEQNQPEGASQAVCAASGSARIGVLGTTITCSTASIRFFSRETTANTGRRGVERFIEKAYRDRFASVIGAHYPDLMCLYGRSGELHAALGLRHAVDHRLFLEQYFDRPIESLVSVATDEAVDRGAIIEIGNLASRGPASTVRLIIAAAAYLQTLEVRFAVVTATREMRGMLDAFGFAWRLIGPARSDLLPDGGRAWGRYYQYDPQVVVGEIGPAVARLHWRSFDQRRPNE
jgi:Thermostable hemolysin